jgi:uncharacterized membrane protein
MVNLYGILKFIHVLSVILWLGGIMALSVFVRRATQEHDSRVLSSLLKQVTSYGQKVVGPASGLVLLTGPVMFGAIVLRQRVMKLVAVSTSPTAAEADLVVAARGLWTAQLIYLAILASVVGAMVLKPTL